MVISGSSLPSSTKKKKNVRPPPTKLSGSAHALNKCMRGSKKFSQRGSNFDIVRGGLTLTTFFNMCGGLKKALYGLVPSTVIYLTIIPPFIEKIYSRRIPFSIPVSSDM